MSSLFTLFVIFILLFLFVSLIADSKYHDSATPVHKEIEREYGTPAKTLFTSTKIITLHSDTTITDEDDEVVYTARTNFLSLHDRTYIYNNTNEEVAYIYRKFFSLHERRFIEMNDGTRFELSNELFHLFKDITQVEGLGWTLSGNIMQLNFTITDCDGTLLAVIGQKYLSMHDKYSVDIYDTNKESYIVAILISLQHMLRDRNASRGHAASSSTS